jgi:formamidopyrimidine-DNA glycosylase
MPELPEVETARRHLRSWAKGRRVVDAHAEKTRVIRGQQPARFAQLRGHRLVDVERSGKWMLLVFDAGQGLLSHLGMTGRWTRRRKSDPVPGHTRATLALDDGHLIDYRDARLFGRLIRGKADELRQQPTFKSLGPDPLEGIDVERLQRLLAKTRRSIKEALMDQRVLAGLGNIHVAESLFRGGVNPERPANSLSADEVRSLAKGIDASLRFALELEASDEPITYVEEGGPNEFLVYGHEGEPCQNCGRAIERIVQGGRSTFFCPHCQPALGARRAAQGHGRRSQRTRDSGT